MHKVMINEEKKNSVRLKKWTIEIWTVTTLIHSQEQLRIKKKWITGCFKVVEQRRDVVIVGNIRSQSDV